MEDKKLKFLTIQEAERATTTSVWVLNYSQPKGNLHFGVADGMGGQLIVKIPVTWIPIDLTTQASKSVLLGNPVFRRFAMQGLLRLVDEESALKLMDSEQAKEEARRIYSVDSLPIAQNTLTAPDKVKGVQMEAMGNVSGFAMNLANTTDVGEDQIMNSLIGQESALTKADFQYIAQNSQFPKVKEYASKKVVETMA